jgi:hypothetical protein
VGERETRRVGEKPWVLDVSPTLPLSHSLSALRARVSPSSLDFGINVKLEITGSLFEPLWVGTQAMKVRTSGNVKKI